MNSQVWQLGYENWLKNQYPVALSRLLTVGARNSTAFKPPARKSISKVCHSFHCLDAFAVNRKMKYLEVIFLTSKHREMIEPEKEYWTKQD